MYSVCKQLHQIAVLLNFSYSCQSKNNDNTLGKVIYSPFKIEILGQEAWFQSYTPKSCFDCSQDLSTTLLIHSFHNCMVLLYSKNTYILNRSPDMAAMHQDTSEDHGVVGEKLKENLGVRFL